MQSTYTITFGNAGENHKGMQIIGSDVDTSLSCKNLKKIKEKLDKLGCETEYIKLHTKDLPKASILIVRNGLEKMLDVDADDLLSEQQTLEYDKKAYMYGRVVNKKARWNICFDEHSQEAVYEEGKGTIVAWKDVPKLKALKKYLEKLISKYVDTELIGEGNWYYDVKKTYIGYHGDTERKIVIAVRLGEDFPLYYQWYHRGAPVGDRIDLMLHHGDLYFMSEKAVGTDWKKSSNYTLRHAAGYEKNIKK